MLASKTSLGNVLPIEETVLGRMTSAVNEACRPRGKTQRREESALREYGSLQELPLAWSSLLAVHSEHALAVASASKHRFPLTSERACCVQHSANPLPLASPYSRHCPRLDYAPLAMIRWVGTPLDSVVSQWTALAACPSAQPRLGTASEPLPATCWDPPSFPSLRPSLFSRRLSHHVRTGSHLRWDKGSTNHPKPARKVAAAQRMWVVPLTLEARHPCESAKPSE